MKFSLTNPSSLTDMELVKRYKSTRQITWVAELFSRYTHLIFGVCMKYLKHQEDSKDATMHIFELMQEKLLVHEIKNPGGWIHVTTRNHCLMQLRSQQLHAEKEKELLSDMEFSIPEHHNIDIGEEINMQLLNTCLEQLSAEQQKCIKLFYLDEKCYLQVANLTGYDLRKVKSYLQNGKRNLKICMEKNREKE
jgi:RNA polymerase sigma-70 factor (ECF subfamily)